MCRGRSGFFEITGLTVPTDSGTERAFLKDELKTAIAGAAVIPFENQPTIGNQKRLVSISKNSFYKEDLSGELPFGEIAFHALPYQTYEAVYTQGLIGKFKKDGTVLITSTEIETEAGFIQDGNYWWRTSGKAIFDENHFYLPIKQLDPFGHIYEMEYDAYFFGDDKNDNRYIFQNHCFARAGQLPQPATGLAHRPQRQPKPSRF